MFRRLGLILLALTGAVALLAIAGIAVLHNTDWRAYIEREATAALERPLTIGTLQIGWGRRLTLDATDIRLRNVDWGSRPDMISIVALSAEIDLFSLLGGVLRFERLAMEKPVILLERRPDGTPNWKFAPASSGSGGIALIPKNRTEFPTLIDLRIKDGELAYRSRGDLRLGFTSFTMQSAADDTPVMLAADGTYNGARLRVDGETASYRALRDATRPYPTRLSVTHAAGGLTFDGTMTEPLDFEGVKGAVAIEAGRDLGALLKAFGLDIPLAYRARLAGTLDKRRDDWRVPDAAGTLAANEYSGSVGLIEGKRGQPDHVVLDLNFRSLDLNALLPPSGASQNNEIDLALEKEPGVTVDVKIAARQFAYEKIRSPDLLLHARTAPSHVQVNRLSMGLAGGRLDARGEARSLAAGTRLSLSGTAQEMATADLARLMDSEDPPPIAGNVSGRASLNMTGKTLQEALGTAEGQAIVTMTGGNVARDLLEKASTDLRALFRRNDNRTSLTCLLGVVDIEKGVATIAPLRLRTPDTGIVAAGRINLQSERMDIVLQAERTRGVLALGAPVNIKGTVGDPSFGVLSNDRAGEMFAALDTQTRWQRLAPELRDRVSANACRPG